MLKWNQEDKEKTKQTKLNNKILKITSPQINKYINPNIKTARRTV